MKYTAHAVVAKSEDIAIIGMAARFPGAANVDEFWTNIRDGVESIRRLSEEQLLAAGVPRATFEDPDYVRACPVLADVDKFDAGFFGFSARDASVMDPAHRIFLETAWQAFEHAGYTALPEEGAVGVFAASGAPLYLMENLKTNPDLMKSVGDFLVRHTGNDMNFLATRVSYEMDLRGPSINVQTACSSSLVSVHLACQSLSRGECVMALAGGSTVIVPKDQGYHFREGEILSPDGHCRPFDAKSAGTVFGSGAGAVILKRLSDALDDGDTIHAVIKGSAINNDGALKVSYLAPGVEGQAAVVGSALDAAGVTADSIGYIETHGTGTLVGDPIEVEALNEAFKARTNRRGFCAIGSVKSNIGHLGEAAGAAALIKAVMALKHRQLPPSLGFETPNPAIDFANSPFHVNASLRAWEGEAPLRCGVTALGAGGTNCHLILEEAPAALVGEGERTEQLLVLSAKTRSALDLACDNLARALETNPALDLADAAFTLAVGRRDMTNRRAVAAASRAEAIDALRKRDPKRVVGGVAGDTSRKLVFMFPGGGAQYAGMGRELYEREEVYREAIDECLKTINPALGRDLRGLMFPPDGDTEAATRTLEQPSLTLPALFATEYAIARLFQSWGVNPDALIGHSVGEYAAACLAGVMKLEDAIRLVMLRGRLFEIVQRGSMLSVPLSEKDLRAVLPEGVDIAAVNAAELTVASGPVALISKLEAILAERGIESTAIRIDVAAHSAMLDPVLSQFRELCRAIRFHPPQIPFVSNVSGRWITPEQATSPDYWVLHLRSTVRFADGIASLRELGDPALLEVGPGRTLSMLARAQALPVKEAFNCIRHPQESAGDLNYALSSLGRLWSVGVEIDWSAFYEGQLRNRIALPPYPFESKSFWVEPGKPVTTAQAHDLTKRADLSDWFYALNYAEAPLVVGAPLRPSRIWLLLAEDVEEARRLARAMGREKIVIASQGRKFGEQLDRTWRLDLKDPAHHVAMLQRMEEHVGVPDHVILLASRRKDVGRGDEAVDRSFLTPTYLLQALAAVSSPVQVSIITAGASGAGGAEIDPARALALGPVLVGPREFEQLHVRAIDLPSGRLSPDAEARVVERLAQELLAEPADTLVALQPAGRWVRKASPLPLPAASPTSAPTTWVRDGGVYLITGGLGGIGLEVAEHMARARPVKLALLARDSLPPEKQWDDILAENANARTAQRIRRVLAIRKLGSEVMIVAADIADKAQVASAVEQARRSLGPLNGVIHAAGVMDDAPMLTKTVEAMKQVLAPKVAGTLAIDAAVRDDLDFFILFSSVASFLGLPGQVDYTAANAFQDAFARSRSLRARGRSVVINWNAWRDVGMAASAHRLQTMGIEPEHVSRHPALDGYADTRGGRIFVARFQDDASWQLSEHVVKGGPALLPGTAFVELARAAFAEARPAAQVELTDLAFAAPFRADEAGAHRLTIELHPAGPGYAINMRAGTDPQAEPIVTGQVKAYDGPAPGRLDLQAIKARCSLGVTSPATGFLDQSFMTFGPRWANIRHIQQGQGESLIELALGQAFAGDLGGYGLHPAMLDMATGGAQALIPDADLSKDFYVPLGYGRVRVFSAMPGQVYSHVRCLSDSGNGIAYFDVTLSDASGRVFADISRFTMRRLEANASLAAPDGARTLSRTRNDTMASALREAITPREGLEALDRVMAQPGTLQIVASSVDVNVWSEQLRSHRSESVVGEGEEKGFSRPDIATDYVAPATPTERALAKIWSDLLGFKHVGVQDNFFDLGGNSLLGVRLFAAIRKQFTVSLPLATLFEAQTIADLVKLVAEPGGEEPATEATWSPMVRLKAGAPGQTPIFFIHGSRGNVLVFKAFADRVGAEQPCYALQARGVDGAAPPDQTIEVMAERYLEAVRKVQPKGPYMFAGYSGGGVIAYEMTRRLKQSGESVKLLMLVDTLEPSAIRTKVTMLDRVLNFHHIKPHRYLNLPKAIWQYHAKRVIRRWMGVGELTAPKTPLENASDAVDAAYKHAQWAYQTPVLETDVVLIRALDARMHFLRSGPTLGWRKFVKGRIHRFDVEIDHDRVFEEPALSAVLAAFYSVTGPARS